MRDVPRPASEIGDALRLLQMDIGVGERGGALLHAPIEFALGAAQLLLGAPAHGQVNGKDQTRHLQADHEGEQQQEGFIDAQMGEGTDMIEHRPDDETGKDHADTGGVARAAPERRLDQRQDGEEAERARILAAPQERAEGARPARCRRAPGQVGPARVGAKLCQSLFAHNTIAGVSTSAPVRSPSH